MAPGSLRDNYDIGKSGKPLEVSKAARHLKGSLSLRLMLSGLGRPIRIKDYI